MVISSELFQRLARCSRMIRLAPLALALVAAGCTRGVLIERMSFEGIDRGYRQVLAELDTDLRDLEYFIRFEYAVRADDTETPAVMTHGVEYLGPYSGIESLPRSLADRRGAAVSEGPSRVRIYLPWPGGHEAGRFVFLRLRGCRPYSCLQIESNTIVAELPP